MAFGRTSKVFAQRLNLRGESLVKERFRMRDEILHRVDLSPAARLLYLDLDNRARNAGRWFVKRQRLAVELGFSLPALDRYTAELVSGGCLRKERNQASCTYVLTWSDLSPVMNHNNERFIAGDESELSPGTDLYLNVLNPVNNPVDRERVAVCRCGRPYEETPVRCACGYLLTSEPAGIDSIPTVRQYLMAFTEYSGGPLRGSSPDDEICRRIYSAAGSLVLLDRNLREIAKDRSKFPKTSYAWFEAVLRKKIG